MCKAQPGEIWVDAQTKKEAEGQLAFETLPSLPFKGFDKPVDIYSPVFADDEEDIEEVGKPTAGSGGSNSASSSPATAGVKVQESASKNSKKLGASGVSHALVGSEPTTLQIARVLFLPGETEPVRMGLLEGEGT
jgi:hypothetical protein